MLISFINAGHGMIMSSVHFKFKSSAQSAPKAERIGPLYFCCHGSDRTANNEILLSPGLLPEKSVSRSKELIPISLAILLGAQCVMM